MVINEWIEKYELLRKSCDDIVPIQASMMFLSESLISEHALLVSDLARYSINSSFEENRKGNYYFSDKMIEGVKKHKAIEKAIKLAMSEKRFEVYFQPIYSNADGKVMGAELGCDYEQGYYFSKPIPPAEFIAYMEAQAGQV